MVTDPKFQAEDVNNSDVYLRVQRAGPLAMFVAVEYGRGVEVTISPEDAVSIRDYLDRYIKELNQCL